MNKIEINKARKSIIQNKKIVEHVWWVVAIHLAAIYCDTVCIALCHQYSIRLYVYSLHLLLGSRASAIVITVAITRNFSWNQFRCSMLHFFTDSISSWKFSCIDPILCSITLNIYSLSLLHCGNRFLVVESMSQIHESVYLPSAKPTHASLIHLHALRI